MYRRSVAGKSTFYHWTVKREKSDDRDEVNFTSSSLPPRAKVKHLGVQWDIRADALPPQLAEFTALEYLAVPGALVHTLTAAMVPKTLRRLNIVSDESTKYALDDALVLPQLRELIGFTKLAFRAEQVPNVTRVEVKLATDKMAAELARLPLTSLGFGPLADNKQLAMFAKLKLSALTIVGGNVTSLAGVERFTALTTLSIRRLTRLTDLSALAKLSQLREVTISFCPRLAKVDAIGKLPKLRLFDPGTSKVTPKSWKALEAVLRKRKVRFDLPENIDEDEDEDDE